MCLPTIQEDVSDDGEKDLMANIDGFVRSPMSSLRLSCAPGTPLWGASLKPESYGPELFTSVDLREGRPWMR